jgi:predicted HicB family RNase H-like nuclease
MSQTLPHKGYEGSVLYSAEDRLLHGKILGIRDMVIYDGIDIPTIEKNFRDAVDEYLAFCEQIGKTPSSPSKGGFTVHPESL